jgi:antitoxin HigA-1
MSPTRASTTRVNRRRGVTPSTALRLARYFGNSRGFWLSLQHRWDLYHAMKAEAQELTRIEPVQPVHPN